MQFKCDTKIVGKVDESVFNLCHFYLLKSNSFLELFIIKDLLTTMTFEIFFPPPPQSWNKLDMYISFGSFHLHYLQTPN